MLCSRRDPIEEVVLRWSIIINQVSELCQTRLLLFYSSVGLRQVTGGLRCPPSPPPPHPPPPQSLYGALPLLWASWSVYLHCIAGRRFTAAGFIQTRQILWAGDLAGGGGLSRLVKASPHNKRCADFTSSPIDAMQARLTAPAQRAWDAPGTQAVQTRKVPACEEAS